MNIPITQEMQSRADTEAQRHQILVGDCIDMMGTLPDQSAHTRITSPPYFGLRDYGVDGQIGLEASPRDFIDSLIAVFRQVRRVLRDDGTLRVNWRDSYASGGRGGGGRYMAERGDGAWKGKGDATGWRSAPAGWEHKVCWASHGAWRSLCRMRAGTCARTSSGTSPTLCLNLTKTGAPRPTNTCSCSARARATTSIKPPSASQPEPMPRPRAPAGATALPARPSTPRASTGRRASTGKRAPTSCTTRPGTSAASGR